MNKNKNENMITIILCLIIIILGTFMIKNWITINDLKNNLRSKIDTYYETKERYDKINRYEECIKKYPLSSVQAKSCN